VRARRLSNRFRHDTFADEVAYRHLGDVFWVKKDFHAAFEAFTKVTRLEPRDVEAHRAVFDLIEQFDAELESAKSEDH
jgi:hypothetical protein